ncbi:MAG: hypothetical protein K9M44_01680 [Candidatus Pacebacteria bacterium]|nr:hypothetical protein [Candidatus Paceibacterota bacterium]
MKIKRKKFSLKKKIIIIVITTILVLSSLIISLDWWKFSPLASNIASKKLLKLSEASFSCREQCNYWLSYYLKIICASRRLDNRSVDRIEQVISSQTVSDSFKLALIEKLKNSNCLEKHPLLFNSLKAVNLETYFILNEPQSSDLLYQNNMREELKTIISDKSLPLTQRKTAFRSLWSVFGTEDLFSFYKEIIATESSEVILLEAVKAISNLKAKATSFSLNDLSIYKKLLSFNNPELEKAVLFLLADYYQLYGEEMKPYLNDLAISNNNIRLFKELFN